MRTMIILSDLWGKEKSSPWIDGYFNRLAHTFDVRYYDCCELGEVNKTTYTEESLHQQFVTTGIETAVRNLVMIESGKVNILGFSIGGTIGWKYALQNRNAESLTVISSTRLRYETQKPDVMLTLYYGENDMYKPNALWFNTLNIAAGMEHNAGHELYKQPDFIEKVCDALQRSILRSGK